MLSEKDTYPELQCELSRVEIVLPDVVVLYLPEFGCVDMGGAVRLAERLLPAVQFVLSVSGADCDVQYYRAGDGWKANGWSIARNILPMPWRSLLGEVK